MKPQEALQILEQVTATYKGTRDDHVKIQDAIKVLAVLVFPKEEPAAAAEEKPKKK